MELNVGFWHGRRVLLTGHTGFKGGWLALWLHELGARVTGLGLPPDEGAVFCRAMAPWPSITEHLVDIRDRDTVRSVVARADPEIVFHLAAQPLVRRGHRDPERTFGVNVTGTLNLLGALEKAPSVQAAVVVTTDKVYRDVEANRPFVESDPLGGRDPYSASKASVEIAVNGWRSSLRQGSGRPCAVATARAGNVIGGGDWAEDRLLPDVLRAHLAGEPVRLRNPSAVRPWQYVLEPLFGYLLLAEALATREEPPAALNFGPGPDSFRKVGDVAALAFGQLEWGWWVEDERGGPTETHVLMLDASLALRELGWRPCLGIEEAVVWTVRWFQADRDGRDMRRVSAEQIEHYAERQAGHG